jgi:hypothetical protein
VLERIQAWSADPSENSIFWLRGMAGTGKSTIARTVATAFSKRVRLTDMQRLPDEICLGASFFFSQSDTNRNNAKKLFTTLARGLAEVLPDLKGYICDSMAEHGDIGGQSLRNQWEHLIFQPLLTLGMKILSPLTLVIVIDALDAKGNVTRRGFFSS